MYKSESATLRVVFLSGMIYEYKNVPEEIYQQMRTASSKGKYLNEHIKGRYIFEKIN